MEDVVEESVGTKKEVVGYPDAKIPLGNLARRRGYNVKLDLRETECKIV